MARGRPPKPTHLKAIDGGAGHRSGPEKTEDKPAGLPLAMPEAPPHIASLEVAHAEWQRVVPELYKAGLMAELYLQPLGAYCLAVARLVEAENSLQTAGLLIKSPNGYPIQNPYLAIANKAQEQIRAWATEFGMTAVAQSRLGGAQLALPLGDGFDDFVHQRG